MSAAAHFELREAERLVVIEAQLASSARQRVRDEAAQRTARAMSILGAAAALLSLYDLTLLARMGGS
ncbi:MAG TPA: hypothetical protein VG650_03850 [Mycobacteriales bacterium]|nr:hypothetical protein [Mycobacteriales bacterium]